MTRYTTTVVDGTVFIDGEVERIEVGSLDTIIDVVGGPAWTIEYSDEDRRRYPNLDMSDEGLTIDVRDTIEAMTFDQRFVETLKAQPVDAAHPGDELSPRLGLFTGRLLENLEYGVR